MSRFGFCGGTYQSLSVNVDAQRCVNLFPEYDESQQGRSAVALYTRPGLGNGITLNDGSGHVEGSVPRLFFQNGRMFAAGLFLWEVFSNSTFVFRGALNPALGTYVQLESNQNQLLVLSNGNLYLMNLTTNILTPVNMAQFNGAISAIAYCDGFFLAVQQNSQVFYTSNLLDGTTWQAVNAEQVSLINDFIVSIAVSHRDVWIHGNKSSVVYGNSGAALAPFVPISGAFVEQGSISPPNPVRADNSLFWVGQDERGSLIAWRANAYTPQRVSTHAVENAWRQYQVVSDLVTYACQFNGHIFWVLYFQSANATWVYDIATGLWHEWDYSDPSLGQQAHRSQTHCFAFGRHWVGDWLTGTIYQMDLAFNDDFGTPIKRLRRAPTVSTELEWMQHYYMQLDLETGVGTVPGNAPPTTIILQSPNGNLWAVQVNDLGNMLATPITSGTPNTTLFLTNLLDTTTWLVGISNLGNLTATAATFNATGPNNFPMVSVSGSHVWLLEVNTVGNLQTVDGGLVKRAAQVTLRWSDDSGHTWSNAYSLPFGKAGEFKTRVIWRRLGRSRQRVYEVTCSDPVKFAVVDAYLKATNYTPMERYSHQLRKEA